jgi:hypothetical protein
MKNRFGCQNFDGRRAEEDGQQVEDNSFLASTKDLW